MVIKLLAIAELTPEGAISVRVHPALISRSHPLAAVRESFNAVFVEAKSAGQMMFYGRGAGGEPTTPQPSMPTLRVFIGEVSQTYESCRGASTTSRFSRSASFSLRKICRALPFSTATTAGRVIWL